MADKPKGNHGQFCDGFLKVTMTMSLSITSHDYRLMRDLDGAFRKPRYASDELIIELWAVLLGNRLEIGN